MFPTREESKAFFNEKEVVATIIQGSRKEEFSNPLGLLIWASKYPNKNEKC